MGFWTKIRELEVYNTGSFLLYKIFDKFYTAVPVEDSKSDFSKEISEEQLVEIVNQLNVNDCLKVQTKMVFEDGFFTTICIHYTAIAEYTGYVVYDEPQIISINGREHSLQFYASAEFMTCTYPKVIFKKK